MIATMPSPPGRFSITTGLPHRSASRSAKMRAVMSTPLPGPRGTIKRTCRCGHDGAGAFCARAGKACIKAATTATLVKTARSTARTRLMTILMGHGGGIGRPHCAFELS